MPDLGKPQRDYTGVSTDQLARSIQTEIDAGRITLGCLAHRISCVDPSIDIPRKLRAIMGRETGITALDMVDKITIAMCRHIGTDLAVIPMARKGAAKQMALDEWWCLWEMRQVATELPPVEWLKQRVLQLDASREAELEC